MSWVRIHDAALESPKISRLSDRAFRCWVWGLSYTQTHLTDGLIPKMSVPRYFTRCVKELLEIPPMIGRAALWEPHDVGYKIHDYLDWNDSREVVENRQRLAKHRRAFLDDPQLRYDLRERDGDQCRYCGSAVDWRDRKGRRGATYDHVDPRGPATLDNLVVACRGCNSKKRDRLPEIAGMRLRPVPGSRSDLDPISASSARNNPVTKPNQTIQKEKKELSPAKEPPDPRVREFLNWFIEEYKTRRHGAEYLVKWGKHTTLVKPMLKAVSLDRLQNFARILLSDKTDDEFIVKSDRGIEVLSVKFNWISERLAQFEARTKVGAA